MTPIRRGRLLGQIVLTILEVTTSVPSATHTWTIVRHDLPSNVLASTGTF